MFDGMLSPATLLEGVVLLSLFILIVLVAKSIYSIGPTQVGLVRKRFGAKLPGDNPVAFKGEAGYQAELLMPGLRFKFCGIYAVAKHPWVQVPAGQIGVVIAQVGAPTPIGAKSGVYKNEFGNFTDVSGFVANGGQKGVQRPVLSPGMLAPVHPVAFLIITKPQVFGVPITDTYRQLADQSGRLTFAAFGLEERQLEVTRIAPRPTESGKVADMIGIVTSLEGQPLQAGAIASRLGVWDYSTMLRNSKRSPTPPTFNSSPPSSAAKTRCTTTTRISSNSSMPVARSACNTIRFSTALTT